MLGCTAPGHGLGGPGNGGAGWGIEVMRLGCRRGMGAGPLALSPPSPLSRPPATRCVTRGRDGQR
eukprot:4311312-Pleurochrysis_carterae.AAC.1